MDRVTTGIDGLDRILGGGWPSARMILVVGRPGTGKTTIGFQFLLEGRKRGERCLYVTLSETAAELEAVARCHGWDLDGVDIFELDAAKTVLGLGDAQTMFEPSDVEFRATSQAINEAIERVAPDRVVFDSLSELSFLARDALAFRRELLMLKQSLMTRGTAALLLSDGTAPDADRHLHSLVHGVMELEELSPEYGPERRRLRVRKLRGVAYRGGVHDFRIVEGGVVVYPRLVAADQGQSVLGAPLESGVEALDELLGGGLTRGTSTLFMGPAGSGKSSMVGLFAHSAALANEPSALFMFDEEKETFLRRTEALGAPLRPYVDEGLVRLHQIDPAQLSPGEFIHMVREEVDAGARFISIDSLNGYVFAMPNERYLTLQLHELLSYLAKKGVVTALVLAQSGLVGPMTSPADVTYIADAVLIFRFFEAHGEIRRALSMMRRRSGHHGKQIRELAFTDRIRVGESLRGFRGILTGTPDFVGEHQELFERADDGD